LIFRLLSVDTDIAIRYIIQVFFKEENHNAVIRQTTCDNAGAPFKGTHTCFEQGSSLPIYSITAGSVFRFQTE